MPDSPDPSALDQATVRVVGPEHVQHTVRLGDASGLSGTVGTLAHPETAAQVRELVAWAYAHDVAILPVGGQTGFAGGVVPLPDDVTLLTGDLGPLADAPAPPAPMARPTLAIALDRLTRVRSFDPLLWRIHVEAGITTAHIRRLARENGLLYPPDPGSAESSQIGGNLATNAGGPHAFKYGVTRNWVSGIEAVIAPGKLVQFGGPIRKDASGYDLRGLLIGSEGTLGIITAAWLRLTPAPAAAIPVTAAYASVAAGIEAIESVLASGITPATIEYLDGSCLRLAPPPFAGATGETSAMGPTSATGAAILVISEAESPAERNALLEALGPGATAHDDPRAVWRWRGGVSLAVRAARGEKHSEDIVVPLDRLGEAIEETLAIGARHRLETCSWGHAGDGNLHSTFLFDPADAGQRARANAAARELFELARRLGGSVSGEHGLGLLKRGQLMGQWSEAAIHAHEAVKHALDPKGLFNPGKKLARP